KRAKSLLRVDSGRGISLWKVWNELCEHAHRAELRPARASENVPRDPIQLVERALHGLAEELGGKLRIVVCTTGRLRHDAVDHPELEAVGGVGLEGGSSLRRLLC